MYNDDIEKLFKAHKKPTDSFYTLQFTGKTNNDLLKIVEGLDKSKEADYYMLMFLYKYREASREVRLKAGKKLYY